jgi:hypothetical protein
MGGFARHTDTTDDRSCPVHVRDVSSGQTLVRIAFVARPTRVADRWHRPISPMDLRLHAVAKRKGRPTLFLFLAESPHRSCPHHRSASIRLLPSPPQILCDVMPPPPRHKCLRNRPMHSTIHNYAETAEMTLSTSASMYKNLPVLPSTTS